jgi:hypothetical protein
VASGDAVSPLISLLFRRVIKLQDRPIYFQKTGNTYRQLLIDVFTHCLDNFERIELQTDPSCGFLSSLCRK